MIRYPDLTHLAEHKQIHPADKKQTFSNGIYIAVDTVLSNIHR